MREPRYPLPRVVLFDLRWKHPDAVRVPEHLNVPPTFVFLGAFCAGGGVVPVSGETTDADVTEQGASRECTGRCTRHTPRRALTTVHGSFCWAGFDNDPSAGSPTETLLRLLLPLNDKVQWTSRDVAGGEPLTSPRSEHFTGPFNR